MGAGAPASCLTGQEPRRNGGGAVAAAANERQNVRQDLTQADSDLLSETLNETLIAWICEYNGLAPCHVYRQIQEEEDLKARAEADQAVASMGYELDENAVLARYGEGWRKRQVQVVAATQEVAQAAASFAEPGPAPAPPAFAPDAMDALVQEALADWQPLLQPMVQPLQALLAQAAADGCRAAAAPARRAGRYGRRATG